MTEPRTEAGKRLLWMLRTDEGPRHTRWPRVFDARLTERIVQDFVRLIEIEAARRYNDGEVEIGMEDR